MKIVKDKIFREELAEMAQKTFGGLVKAVVDAERKIMAVDGELHADLELFLMEAEENCFRENLWGINIYPEASEADWLEFDSMINLKPHLGNRTRGVDNEEIRRRIIEIVNCLVENE